MKIKNWADDGWNDFVTEHDLDVDSIPRAVLLDMKEAWLHGARTALAQAHDVMFANSSSEDTDAS